MAEPKVAYDPVPTAKPDMPRAAQINVQVPRIDFTDAIGRGMQALGHGYGVLGDQVKGMGSSLEHAGAMFEHAGDEIFKRAIALQEIDNETKVMEATSGYEIQQGQAEANFLALKGNNAAGQYPAYSKAATDLRKQVRDTLPNDAARRAFDNRTMPMMGRTIMQGARHAGAEQKNAYINGLEADVHTWNRQVQNAPFDDGLYEDAQNGLKESIRKKNEALGNPPNVAETEYQEQKDKLLAGRLTAQSSERPFETWDAFQGLKDQLPAATRDQVEHTLMDNMRGAGSKYLADKVTTDFRSGKPNLDKSIQERTDEAMKSVPEQLKDDPAIRKNVRDRIESIFNDDIKNRQIIRYNNTNSLYKILAGEEEGRNGKIPKDEEDFKATTDGKRIWASEDEIGKQKIRDAIRHANDAALHVDPRISDTNRRTWLGMSWDNPSQFFEQMQDPNVLYGQMNREDRNFIRGIYERMLKDPKANPNVTKAMQWLRDANGTTLMQLGVDRIIKGQNEEDYYNFRGSVLLEIEDWMQQHKGVPPTRKEFDDNIAPNLLKWKPQTWGMWWRGESGDPYWKSIEVPAEWKEQRKKEIADQKGIDPDSVSEQQLQHDYLVEVYRAAKEQRQPGKPKPEPKPGKPEEPEE